VGGHVRVFVRHVGVLVVLEVDVAVGRQGGKEGHACAPPDELVEPLVTGDGSREGGREEGREGGREG